MDASARFRGKHITIMGLGLLGRGVGDARYLAECGAELIVTDLKSREALAESVAQLERYSNITFVLGEHRLEDFRERDLVLKAAGVPLDSPYIAEAKKNGISVRMSADLFAEISGTSVIGVTGTRGKSTVTHMLYAILTAAKKPVVLGGNVRGVSTLALLPEVTPSHTAVLELDSWQCQGFGEARISPHLAVFTTLYPDHLNYYKNDLGAYLADKANIFLYQEAGDVLVLGAQCAPTVIDRYGEEIESKTLDAAGTILIVGGADKGLDMSALISKLPELKRVVLLAGSGTERIRAELPNVPVYNDLSSAVADALAHANTGDIVLFSPAFASFGMFKNEYDRGDQFAAIVQTL